MLGLNAGELTLFVLLVFAVVSSRFWPAAGARIAEKLFPPRPEPEASRSNPKSERTNDANST